MTLFIAYCVIYGLHLDATLYFWALVLWAFHLGYHETKTPKKH